MPDATFRKYKNRQLYDLEASRYVNLENARAKLLRGAKVCSPRGEDVTAEVLAQLIQLDQRKRKRGLTADKLREFIASYMT